MRVPLLARCPEIIKSGTKVKQLVQKLQAEPLPADTILNVNVPDISYEQLTGQVSTRLGHRPREPNPAWRSGYWRTGPGTARTFPMGF